jgi:3-oxoacyl-[acyl-carrier protein] reductase
MAGKLENKVAIVTGSGQGIGRAIAQKFAFEGAKVVVNDLEATFARKTVDKINATGGKAVGYPGDVTERDFGDRLVNFAIDQFGALDVIVNNAGYTWDNVIQKMSDEQFEAMLAVHVTAPFRILRAAQPHIKAQALADREAGREVFRKVVNISSIAGLYGNAGQAGYSTAKAALVGLTRTLCKEWGRYKVCVNAVAFGLVETRMTQPLTGRSATIEIKGQTIEVGVREEMLAQVRQMTPLGRGARPDEAAGAVAMLCYPESDHVSGQILIAGGGLLI